MTLAAALWLLLSCSDFMGTGWAYADAGWHLGLRQSGFAWTASAEGSILQSQATASPWATDLLLSFPRPITRAEKPFVQTWVKIPILPDAPNGVSGHKTYLGNRVTITRYPNDAYVWSGIFVGRDDSGVPTLFYRVLEGWTYGRAITDDSWWTLGMSWGKVPVDPFLYEFMTPEELEDTADGYWHGVVSFYAAPGKVELTEADKFATDDAPFPLRMKTLHGHFLDIALAVGEAEQPQFVLAQITTHAAIVPTLEISRDGQSVTLTTSGYPTEQYQLQRSEDLVSWLPQPTANDPIVNDKQFYRAVSQ